MIRLLNVLLAGAAAMALCAPASAQKMYRCGNNYQDKPCDAGQKGRVVGSTGVEPAAAPAAGAPYAAQCAQRGKDSLQIIWAREGGATEERMLSEAQPAQRSLVQEVYRKRGSASQIQGAIEADCVAQKEKEARAALLMEAALKAQADARGGSPTAPAAPPVPAVQSSSTPPDTAMRAEIDARNAETKRRNCSRLAQEMDWQRDKERMGGNAAAMERFADDRRRLQKQLDSEGC